jgi:hypothetical protein
MPAESLKGFDGRDSSLPVAYCEGVAHLRVSSAHRWRQKSMSCEDESANGIES